MLRRADSRRSRSLVLLLVFVVAVGLVSVTPWRVVIIGRGGRQI